MFGFVQYFVGFSYNFDKQKAVDHFYPTYYWFPHEILFTPPRYFYEDKGFDEILGDPYGWTRDDEF